MNAPPEPADPQPDDGGEDPDRVKSQFALMRLLIALKEIRAPAPLVGPVADDDGKVR